MQNQFISESLSDYNQIVFISVLAILGILCNKGPAYLNL